MKKHFYLLKTCLCALAVGVLAGCSAEVDGPQVADGEGAFLLNVATDADFETTTRALDESPYANVDNYTVRILQNGAVQDEYSYTEVKDTWIPYGNGTYTVKAFYGEDLPVSTTSMYVEGHQDISISNDTAHVSFTCKPVCAKVTVKFDETMADYFSAYHVVFKTKALGEGSYDWQQTFTDPVYMKVTGEKETVNATIYLTKKSDGTSTTMAKTYELAPAMQKTITMKPTVNNGNVGITIEIDETTDDHEITIEIPSDWV